MDGAGAVRPGWDLVFPSLASLLPGQTSLWKEQTLRLLHQNGILFKSDGKSQSHVRPWELDTIPHILAEDDWKDLEAGLIQRARLLNLILQDIYGPMTLLEKKLLPAELMDASSHFLRACHGTLSPEESYLHMYSADVGRAQDGSFRILGDRSQSLAGAGYALENRIVISRVLSQTFQTWPIHRLALTFQRFREHLAAIALTHRDRPNIVLLSPGSKSPDYFEHTYLARYLGFPIVFGEDLTFREDHIYLKTLSGLNPVDVVLRFVDDVFSDPLELDGATFQGVTGLLQAWRAKNVVIANVPGAGLIENPGFLPFLPGLCQELLGEPLKIPSVSTWWLGDEAQRRHVLDGLPNFIIKPLTPTADGITSYYPGAGSPEDLQKLREEILARPRGYIAQERLPLSQVPVVNAGSFEPRSLSLRTFAFAQGDSYQVLPGGLTLFSSSPEEFVVSDHRSVGCKDTWVISKTPVPVFSLLPPASSSEILRTGGDVVSRVADNLFWLGRYAERVHFQARLLRAFLSLQFEDAFSRTPLQSILKEAVSKIIHPLSESTGAANDDFSEILQDESDKTTFSGMLSALYEAAQGVRERLSNDAWRVFIQIHEISNQMKSFQKPNANTVLDFLDRIILSLAAFEGLASESMSRGQGWRFLEMGKRLERASAIVALIRHVILPAPQSNVEEATVLQTFLEILDGIITYRRRYHAQIQFSSVFDLAVCDESNPQSMTYQLRILSDHVATLPKGGRKGDMNAEDRLILEAVTKVKLVRIPDMDQKNEQGRRAGLEFFLQELEALFAQFHDALNARYLLHSQTAQILQRSKAQWIL